MSQSDEPLSSTISLTVIMAAKDEEEGLEAAIERTKAALRNFASDFEILIVDDGSVDDTGAIADRLACDDPQIRTIHHETNLNYGLSLLRGIREARCEWILHNPIDLPLAPEDLPLFESAMADSDVIVVRRRDRSANSPWRTLTSQTNALLLRFLFGSSHRDVNFVQFYRREYAQSAPIGSTAPASVTPELVMRAERTGRTVVEVEAEFRRRETGRAHFGKPKDIWWTLRDMMRLRILTALYGWTK